MAEINFDKANQVWTLPWDADWVTAVSFVGPRRLAAGNNLGQIMVWDLPEKPGDPCAPARRLDGHTNVVTRLLATPDGRQLISSSYDHTIRYWDMQAPAKSSETVVLNARTRADAQRRAANGARVPPPIEAKIETQEASQVVAGHKEWILGMAMSPDGQLLVSADDGGQVIVRDRPAGKELRRWQTKGWAYAVALSPDSKQVLVSERLPLIFDSGRYDGIKLYDQATGQVQHDLAAQFKGMYICAAAYAPDGKTLALIRGGEANGQNGKVFLVDPATGKKTLEFNPGHLDGGTDVAFHPDGKHIASSGRDTCVRIWTPDGKMIKELGKGRGGQFKDWIHAVSFSADGTLLAGGDMAGAVVVWSLVE